MNRFVKLGPYVASIAVTATLLLLFIPSSARVESSPVTGARADELRLADELERRRIACTRRMEMRDHIVSQVMGGRLSLLAAGEQFRELNEEDSHFCWSVFRNTFPGATDDERCCRQVIAFVRIDLEDEPARALALGERLEKELAVHLKNGDLHLAHQGRGPPQDGLAEPPRRRGGAGKE